AGDPYSMSLMIRACKVKGVVVGAHPAYPDRANFGRRSMHPGADITAADLRVTLVRQIHTLIDMARDQDMDVAYVKPHGALYNDAVKNRELADLLVGTVKAVNPALLFMGAPKSEMTWAAERHVLKFIPEGFIDRRYTDEGHLVPRSRAGAVLGTVEGRMGQLADILERSCVMTDSGRALKLDVATLCLHGDSDGALATAARARKVIKQAGYQIRSFIHG
ncbi:MAG: LamB/YcsF family protein, partial [Hyphomonadaceae bacterium]|nr:LamB/YcsF family protein [Hyphomonadaceae bacterium]